MQLAYRPKTELEKFGQKVYGLLVENFSQTFYVGGMVRDLLLGRKVTDVDMATSATPSQVIQILNKSRVKLDAAFKNFGVMVAKLGAHKIEIATFRRETYKNSRYPKIAFIKSPKKDSQRRDFTVNALYLSPKTKKILDFWKGLADANCRNIKFIGNPKLRIEQDPLRIVRALRFALLLNFRLERQTFLAIKNNFFLLDKLTKTRMQNEILKLKNQKLRKRLKETILHPELLDKYFKYR